MVALMGCLPFELTAFYHSSIKKFVNNSGLGNSCTDDIYRMYLEVMKLVFHCLGYANSGRIDNQTISIFGA